MPSNTPAPMAPAKLAAYIELIKANSEGRPAEMALVTEIERLRKALHTVHGMCRLNESRHFIGTYVEEVLAVVK